MKEILERAQQVAQIFSLLAVPILVAFFGYMFQSEAKDKEINRDFIQMAVSILTAPAATGSPDTPLRHWATRMLAHASPVPFEEDEFNALKSAKLALAARAFDSAKDHDPWAAFAIKELEVREEKLKAQQEEQRRIIERYMNGPSPGDH